MSELTQSDVLKLFRYDPLTGWLYWRVSRSNLIKVGDRAGGYNKSLGYITLSINRKQTYAHRVIWLMVYGEHPKSIDHINHIRHDNRITNLRAVSPHENSKNRVKRKDNKSGINGVCWVKKESKWYSYISIDGRNRPLGHYDDLLNAVCARKNAEIENGFHINHGR